MTYPVPRRDLEDVVDRDLYNLWLTTTVEWLQGESGIEVKSIIEHLDEDSKNLHFFAVPRLDADMCLNFDAVHPGRKARDAAAARGASRAAQQAAYQGAMSDWQDRFHEGVSKHFCHERLGDRRQRISRERHKALRQLARERELIRAEQELEYTISVNRKEAETRARLVSDDDFKAVATAKIISLQEEVERLKQRIQELEMVDQNEFPIPPLAVTLAPNANNSDVLASFDVLEKFPEPETFTTAGPETDIWSLYSIAKLDAAEKLRADLTSPDSNHDLKDQESQRAKSLSPGVNGKNRRGGM